jgi:hypothetical protein
LVAEAIPPESPILGRRTEFLKASLKNPFPWSDLPAARFMPGADGTPALRLTDGLLGRAYTHRFDFHAYKAR